jgi:hypothetical protein
MDDIKTLIRRIIGEIAKGRPSETASFEEIKDAVQKQGVAITSLRLLETLNRMCEEDLIFEDAKIPLWYGILRSPAETWEKVIDEVDEYRIYPGEEEHFYEIMIKGKVIRLDSATILSPKHFRKEYYRMFGVLLPSIKAGEWCECINFWTRTKGILMSGSKEEIGYERVVTDTILNHLLTAQLIKGIPKKVERGMVYLHNEHIYIPNSEILRILERHGLKVNLRKLSFIVKGYLADSSKVIRTDDGFIRMWVFNPQAVGVDIGRAIEIEKEDKNEGSDIWSAWHGKNDNAAGKAGEGTD